MNRQIPSSPNNERQYRAAVIGCGGMGRSHARALRSLSSVELVALADIDPVRLQMAGDESGVSSAHQYPNIDHLFDSEQLDVVVVATQAPEHCAVTLAAAAHGVHVLCEKPLALSLAEADRMVSACDEARVLLAANHLRRVAPGSRMVRDLIVTGELGDVVAVDIHDKGGRPVGNTLMEMATHYFDLTQFLLGNRPRWVFAHLSTGSGASAHRATPEEIVRSQQAVPTDRDCGLVLGDRGTVVLGFDREIQAVARFNNRPEPDARYDGIDVIGTEGSVALRQAGATRVYRRSGHAWAEHDPWLPVASLERQDVSLQELSGEMMVELVAAVEAHREHVSSGRDALAVLETIMAVYESHRRGAVLALPMQLRSHPLANWSSEHAHV